MIASPTCFRLLLLVAILGSRSLFGQSTGKNFVLERTYKGPRTAVSGNVRDAVQQVSYFDGLGRPLQSINAQASPLLTGSRPADLVSHTEYDAAGRVSKVYAPYPQAYQAASAFGNGRYVNADSAAAKSVAFYNTTANFDQNNNRGYTLTEYEASPLSRVTKQFSVGSDRAVTTSYGSNAASEVNRYDVSGDNPVRNGYYGAGQLVKTSVTDENGNVSVEFKDKSGLTVLRSVQASSSTWLNTYYVYDDLSQLRFVLQPEYQNEGSVSKYAFKYTYNDRGLVSSKYVPGGGTTEMWYDNRDRLIESKDGNGKYTYFKYDELNRVIETGEKAGTTYRALVKTHYDTYSPPFSGVQTFVSGYGNGYPAARRMNVNGQVTVTAARVLNPNGEYDDAKDVWLCTTIYYDDRFNVIQTIRNLFDLGGNNNNYEYVVKQIRFDGRVEKELIEQKVSTGEHFVEKQYTYDHADRLLSVRYVVKKDGAEKKNIVVSARRYDALGQLKKKFLHSADSRSFREQLDYSYVPRSWMSKVTGKTGAGENFGIELKYANATTPQYNGNIGEMLWRQAGSATWPGYKFTYDGANRLSKGEGSGYDYSETVSLYDLNGNIRKLQRKKLTATWDDLTYTYLDGNRLTKVTDAGTAEGFNNGASADSTDYNYDGNGNMTRDKNRGIADGGIRYNILNLPREVAINNLTMKYHYDAAGTKVRMERGTENTKYAGFFEYNSSNYLTRIGIEEGQITITNNGTGSNDYSVDYYLKDHLGNVRQVINEAGTLLQETEYFPFGLAIPRTAGTNKYLYNGKEKQPETGWLDYGARMYDPTVARWTTVDGAATLFSSSSPYSYGLNNPVLYIDPSGDTTYSVNDLPSNWDEFNQNTDEVNLDEVKIVRPGYQKQLDEMYFEEYEKYSPWLPDAYGIQINWTASGIFSEVGFNVGIAMDSKGIAPFVSAGVGAGTGKPGIDISLQFNMSERIDKSKPHKDLTFVNGIDIGNSFGVGVGLSQVQTSANGDLFNLIQVDIEHTVIPLDCLLVTKGLIVLRNPFRSIFENDKMRIYRLIHALLLFEMFRRASRSQIKEDTYLQTWCSPVRCLRK